MSSDSRPVTEPFALSIEEAARLSGFGRTTLYNLIKKNNLKARKVGRRTIILVPDLEECLKSLPLAGRTP
jgi:excisionase family DNA binding protein